VNTKTNPSWVRRNQVARERIVAVLDAGPVRDSASFNDQFSAHEPLAVLWVSSAQLLDEWVAYLLGAGGTVADPASMGRAYGDWRVVRAEVRVVGWRVSVQARVPAEVFDRLLDEAFGGAA
jgi:hypothetical protein